jgi:hypothetical protein
MGSKREREETVYRDLAKFFLASWFRSRSTILVGAKPTLQGLHYRGAIRGTSPENRKLSNDFND